MNNLRVWPQKISARVVPRRIYIDKKNDIRSVRMLGGVGHKIQRMIGREIDMVELLNYRDRKQLRQVHEMRDGFSIAPEILRHNKRVVRCDQKLGCLLQSGWIGLHF